VTSIRLKDIAKELGVGNKELLQALRELGIQVKSQMGTLSADEARQVGEKLRQGSAKAEVVNREVHPGVIVRRRKAAPAEETPAPAKASAHTPAKAPVEEAAAAPETPAESETRAVSDAEATAPDRHGVRARKVEIKPAVIISPARAAAPAEAPLAETAPEPEEQPEAAAPPEPEIQAEAPAEQEVQAEEPVSATAEADETAPAPETGEAAARQERKQKRPKREEPTGPQVRIISMPEPKPAAAPAPARPASPRPSYGSPRPAPGAPGAPGAAPVSDAEAEARKKRKKDMRVVDFSAPNAEEDERRKAAAKKKKTIEIKDKTGAKGRVFKKKRFREEVVEVQSGPQPMKAAKRKVRVEETIRVADMAKQMGVKAQDLIKVLLGLGMMATINQTLDIETATLAAVEFDYEVEKAGFSEETMLPQAAEDAPESLKPRPPVVTIMGHVDHGKTSLLDAIRFSNVVSGEAGGITQHIGAYHVNTPRGEIVFLDTPGHEAFTAMRARGAQVTDLVVLVVAADDGVMDQTREAINHSKAAGVPIVVAVNKIDKEGADPDRVKRELADLGLVAEEWGGDAIFAHVSAKQKIGLDELLELILLQAEVLDLKANPDKPARGRIVEARLDKGRGALATLLIQEGTLKQGDVFLCGSFSGRVRALFNDQGKKIKSAGPAMPVEVQGFEGVPEAGDEFMAMADEKVARRIAETRKAKQRERDLGKATKVTLETFLSAKPDAEAQTLNLVLKADVQGSLEAIAEALNKLSTDKVKIQLIHSGAGAITESDILLASASKAIIIGFNVRPPLKVRDMAEQEHVDIRFYDIIYKLVGDIKDAMSGMLAPVLREVYLGQAEVRNTFSVPKIGLVAGCGVLDGKLTRNALIRLLRDSVVIHTGKLASLRRFKDDVKEVTKGYECGVGIENFNDIKIGDVIEAFENVEEKATL
jgi:translation initiation factor IF-2